jgi:hypothetical protein
LAVGTTSTLTGAVECKGGISLTGGTASFPFLVGNYLMSDVKAATSSTTLTTTDQFFFADSKTAAGAMNCILPAAAAGVVGKIYFIRNIPGGANLTVTPNGTDTIDGVNAAITLTTASGAILICSAAGAWKTFAADYVAT